MCVYVRGHLGEGKRMVVCIVQNGLSFRSYMYAYSQHISMSALYMLTNITSFYLLYVPTPSYYGGPVGRGYEQRFESKNEYEQRSENKIAYGPRAKLRTVHEQNCVRSESKIAYGLRAKLRTVREQKRAGAESKNAYELRAVVYIGFRHYAICFFSLKKWLPHATLASSVCNFPKGC